MDEYISREETIKRIKECYCTGCHSYNGVRCRACGTGDAIDMIEDTTAADVAPVVHGRWIKDNNSLQTDDYYCCYFDYNCSECGNVVNNRYELPKYCPNCGAKMDGGGDDACL